MPGEREYNASQLFVGPQLTEQSLNGEAFDGCFVETTEDGRKGLRNGAPLALDDRPSRPIHQFQIIGQ